MPKLHMDDFIYSSEGPGKEGSVLNLILQMQKQGSDTHLSQGDMAGKRQSWDLGAGSGTPTLESRPYGAAAPALAPSASHSLRTPHFWPTVSPARGGRSASIDTRGGPPTSAPGAWPSGGLPAAFCTPELVLNINPRAQPTPAESSPAAINKIPAGAVTHDLKQPPRKAKKRANPPQSH